jgi:thioredoxin reductase (NADPH)
MHNTDITIIGAGPTGLFAIFEAGMLKMRVHVVDALDFIGGQCMALYPEKPIYDIPAHPSIEAQDLIAKLEEQAAPFDPVYHLGQRVEKLTEQADGVTVTLTNGEQITSKAVIIAAGCGAFGPNRPPLEGLEAYEASGAIRYMVAKREEFRGKRVVIAGGGDSAVDWAISLAELAKEVFVVHRRPKFRCAPESQARLEALAGEGKITMIVPYQLSGLQGTGGALQAVEVATLEGEKRMLEADYLLPFFGLSMELGPIAEWELAIEKKLLDVSPATLQTSRKRIYAIGDIAHYPGKLKLILNGFAEAAMACHDIHHSILHPGETFHFEYSTTKGVPA